MEKIDTYLYNIDIMNNYVRLMKFSPVPQVLEISHGGRRYSFSVLNSGTELIRRPSKKLVKPFDKYQHLHRVYHIVLYCEGETQFLIEDNVFQASPGILAMTGPGERHCFSVGLRGCSKVIYKCFSFILECDTEDDALQLDITEVLSLYFGTPLVKRDFPLALNKRLFARTAGFIDEITEKLLDGDKIASSSSIINFLGFIAGAFFLQEKKVPGDDERGMRKIKNFIEKNFAGKISIKALSKLSGLSGEYIIRSFHEKYMVTPIAYQMELRMKAACSMLSATNLSIGEIAERTGFNDIYHFSKSFRKYCGESPRTYRTASV